MKSDGYESTIRMTHAVECVLQTRRHNRNSLVFVVVGRGFFGHIELQGGCSTVRHVGAFEEGKSWCAAALGPVFCRRTTIR